MHISLTPQLQEYIHLKVEYGLYNNNSEVVRDALRRMVEAEENQKVERLRAEVQKGLQQLENGEAKPYDKDAVMQRVRQKMLARSVVKDSVIP